MKGFATVARFVVAAVAAFLLLWGLNIAVYYGVKTILAAPLLLLAIATVGTILFHWISRRGEGKGLELGDEAGWTPKEDLPPEVAKLRAWMRRLVEPSYLFVAAKTPRFSKLGGSPALPAHLEWPTAHGKPCEFLLQIDLAEIPSKNRPEWLPESGALYGFLNPDWSDDPAAIRIIISDQALEAVEPRQAPDSTVAHPERAFYFKRFRSAPSMEWLGPDAESLDAKNIDAVDCQAEAAGVTPPTFDGVSHCLGGYPQEIQDSWMSMECELLSRGLDGNLVDKRGNPKTFAPEMVKASRGWVLLLQIDSESRQKWNWGDGGMLYVFVRREDARRGDFSKTVTLWQCH